MLHVVKLIQQRHPEMIGQNHRFAVRTERSGVVAGDRAEHVVTAGEGRSNSRDTMSFSLRISRESEACLRITGEIE